MPDVRGFYKHYKGGTYILFAVSVNEANGEHLVHYYSIEKKTRWTRTWDNFFDQPALVHVPTTQYVARFIKVRDAGVNEILSALI